MNTIAIVMLILGALSLLVALWSLQPGHWQRWKGAVEVPSFLAMLAFGVPGALLNAWVN